MKVLGLDLGTNSIGWAYVKLPSNNQKGKIVGSSSYIFPMGVNLEKGTKEVSKNAVRREKRQIRRQGFRSKMRKQRIAETLINHGMFPDIDPIYERVTGQDPKEEHFKKKFQTVIQRIQLPEELRNYFSIDPYEVRSKAYNGHKISLFEIGRIYYQFAQRRGYKETLQDDEEETGVLYKGKPKESKTGINETKDKINEYGTLGNYLHNEDSTIKRLRNRYTLRSMYEDEFEILWNSQQEYYPEVLTESLKQEIGASTRQGDSKDGILFFQRPLHSQKHLIANCSFESDKPRCRLSAIPFELFRSYQLINNIRDGESPLNENDRNTVLELLNSSSRAINFSAIMKKLSNPQGNFNYKAKDHFPINKTISNFRKIFGKDIWENFTSQEQEDIWHIKLTATDHEWLDNYARTNWGFVDEQIKAFNKFNLIDGYANLSRKAILNILPYLEQGYVYHHAVLLGGLRSAFGASVWDVKPMDERSSIEQEIIALSETDYLNGTSLDRIKTFLADHFYLSKNNLKKLYHHSIEQEVEIKEYLPEPENVRNPIVQQALFEIRKLVNQLIKEYGKPDIIRVELARELKSSKNERDSIREKQQEREEINNKIKDRLDEYSYPHTKNNIQKVQLWNETNICPFTGESISIEKLFDDGYVQIEHIIPYSISLNDSLQNKTLCLADKNREKNNRTPYQAFGETVEWEQMKARAYSVFKGNNPKYRRFISKENPDADTFIERQLNDTRYISVLAKNYLKNISSKVEITQGSVVSMLRHYWGLDSLLNDIYEVDGVSDGEYLAAVDSENQITMLLPWKKNSLDSDRKKLQKKGKLIEGNVKSGILYPFKNREDHRHHAIDAIAVACSKKSYLEQISNHKGKGRSNREIRTQHRVEMPWDGFWHDVKGAVEHMLVSHKQSDRVLGKVKKQLYESNGKPKTKNGKRLISNGVSARGALHEETVYGKHVDKSGETYFHVRKPLDAIDNKAKVEKIVDPNIRKLVIQAISLADPNIDLSGKYKVPKNAFFKIHDTSGKKVPLVFLPNKNGNPIPIKKVRVKEFIGNAAQLKGDKNQYVNPKNNHHIIIYKTNDDTMKEEVVTFWEAVERSKQNQPVVQLPHDGKELIVSLQANEMFIMGLSDEEFRDQKNNQAYLMKRLYRIQTLSSKYYEFRLATESKLSKNLFPYYLSVRSMGKWMELNPIKVHLTSTGIIL